MKRVLGAISVVTLLGVLNGGASVAAPKPLVEDPVGDANFVNDQGQGDGSFGDVVGPADATSFGDLKGVIFTNDAKNLYVHVLLEASAPPAAGEGFRARTNPDGPGGLYCLNFEIRFNGAQNDMTAPAGHLADACGGETVEGEVTFSPYGGVMLVVPRDAHEALGKGGKLTAVQAQSFLWSGSYPMGVAGPYFDTTKPGSDYKLKK